MIILFSKGWMWKNNTNCKYLFKCCSIKQSSNSSNARLRTSSLCYTTWFDNLLIPLFFYSKTHIQNSHVLQKNIITKFVKSMCYIFLISLIILKYYLSLIIISFLEKRVSLNINNFWFIRCICYYFLKYTFYYYYWFSINL